MPKHPKQVTLSPVEQINNACIRRGLRLEVTHYHPAFTRKGIQLLAIHKREARETYVTGTVDGAQEGETASDFSFPVMGSDATGTIEILPVSGRFLFTLPWEDPAVTSNYYHDRHVEMFSDGICWTSGKTRVELIDHTNNVVATGRSCTRHGDLFCGSRGITEAYTKANRKLLEALKASKRSVQELEVEAKERLLAESRELASLIRPDTDENTLADISKKQRYVARRLALFS